MKNTDPELTPTAVAAKHAENAPAHYATTPAPKQDRRAMMFGDFTTDYPRSPAMIEFVAGATLASEDKPLPDDASDFAMAGYFGCRAAGSHKR